MFERVGSQLELVLEGGGIKAYPVDASATTPEDERDAAIPEDPARRPVHTEWCGPSSPDLLSGLLFQSIDPRTGRPVEPAGSPIERAEALRSMFISERKQPATPTVPDLAARQPRSPLKRLVDLGFPRKRAYAVLCDTSRGHRLGHRRRIRGALARPTGPSKAPPPQPRQAVNLILKHVCIITSAPAPTTRSRPCPPRAPP